MTIVIVTGLSPACSKIATFLEYWKTLNWSVVTLGRKCNSVWVCIYFSETRLGREPLYLVAVKENLYKAEYHGKDES